MKLPKPRKRGEAFYIEIMINGKRSSATRDTSKECEQWTWMGSTHSTYKLGNMNFISIKDFPILLHRIRGNKKFAISMGLELLIMLFPRLLEII